MQIDGAVSQGIGEQVSSCSSLSQDVELPPLSEKGRPTTEFIREHFGFLFDLPDRVQIEEIQKGLVNFVFRCSSQEATVILRVKRNSDGWAFSNYCNERYATSCLKDRLSVHVPTIQQIGLVECDSEPFAYMTQEYIAGMDGDDFLKLRPDLESYYWEQIGSLMKELHGIEAQGFGSTVLQLGVASRYQYDSFEEYILSMSKEVLSDDLLWRVLGEVERFRAESYFERLAEADAKQSIFCHQDLLPRNTIADERGTIIGLVDYGSTAGSVVAADYSEILFNVNPTQLSAFLSGYQMSESQLNDQRTQIDAFSVLRGCMITQWRMGLLGTQFRLESEPEFSSRFIRRTQSLLA